jgi:putative DNA primase/helicase
MSTPESIKLIDIFNLMNWERPINAYLLAGWCVIAPVCGALKWRPHIWITGGASTGKSWILKFCNELIGDSGYFIEGATTEPGIRRMLDHDAMPIIFDEAEAESASSQMRIQSILELARSASSENGAIVVKGSAGGGKTATSQTRTMILFGSIGMHMSQQSDRSRITVLGLNAPEETLRKQKFEKLSGIYANLVNEDFTQSLKSRTIKLLPTILKNAETFSRACISVLGGQRHGDQLGPLLAGAVSLEYDGEISYEQALEWVRSKDWNEERSLDTSKDETRCFNEIMQHTVNVETDLNFKVDRLISELCIIASGVSELGNSITQNQAIGLLNRYGISIRSYDVGMLIIIANQHKGISKILRGSPWASGNHNKILSRMQNSVALESVRFGNSVSRAVGIPLSVLL